MIANINEQLWKDFDANVAIFLDYIAAWLKTNAANKLPRNYHEGRYWTYNTLEAFHVIFPAWSVQTIRRIIRKCESLDLLVINNFNKKGYDRTNWYSLTDKALEYYPVLSKLVQRIPDNPDSDSCVAIDRSCVGTDAAIPEELNNNKKTTTTVREERIEKVHEKTVNSSSVNKNNNSQILRDMINIYIEVFPNNPKPHPRLISTNLEKVMRSLIKNWSQLDAKANKFTLEAFRKYMVALRKKAPEFSTQPWTNQNGRTKINDLETFCRWNTVVKFIERKLS